VQRHPSLKGQKLLLVRPIDPFTEKPLGPAVMALDSGVDAGPGSVVLLMDEGGSARQMLGDKEAPVRTIVCGIVDQVAGAGRVKKYA
jgi:microcompartment protein CcmK/EutM